MKYISIGEACNVKYQIDTHKGKTETLFFDHLLINMKSVNCLLTTNNINSLLSMDNIIRDPVHPYFNNNSRMLIKSLPLCVAQHDIHKNITHRGLSTFIAKYTRRYNRLIDYINGDQPLCFIHFNEIPREETLAFIHNIKNINYKCVFTLVNISINHPIHTVSKQPNVLNICLTDKPENDWTGSYINWTHLFSIIDLHLTDSHRRIPRST